MRSALGAILPSALALCSWGLSHVALADDEPVFEERKYTCNGETVRLGIELLCNEDGDCITTRCKVVMNGADGKPQGTVVSFPSCDSNTRNQATAKLGIKFSDVHELLTARGKKCSRT